MNPKGAPLMTTALPDPESEPTVDLWPTAAHALGIGRNTAYDAARRGEIPTIRFGQRLRVPTAALREMLGMI
jgi:excisionase family DNA binding protein